MPTSSIRRAQPGDAPDIARIHVHAWVETYTPLLPRGTLDGITVAQRETLWSRLLGESRSDWATFAALLDGAIVGFATCGRARSEALGTDGEFHAINILRHAQRQGLGLRLMQHMAAFLIQTGCGSAGLWVIRENTGARAFYERLGGLAICEETSKLAEYPVRQIAYRWSLSAGFAAGTDYPRLIPTDVVRAGGER